MRCCEVTGMVCWRRIPARGVLDVVLADRICFTPDRTEHHRYMLTLPIAFDRVMIAALPELGREVSKNAGVPDGIRERVESSIGRPCRLVDIDTVERLGRQPRRLTSDAV